MENKLNKILEKITKEEAEFLVESAICNLIYTQLDNIENIDLLVLLKKKIESNIKDKK